MKRTTLLLVLLAAALLFVWGCERNVTNEVVNEVAAANCFGCHNDMDGKLQQAEGEWNNSIHASGTSIDYTNRVAPNDCVKCHDHQGFVDFITTGTINPPYENVSAIHCFTCHAPHSSGTLELRATSPVTLATAAVFNSGAGNLCANCHQARGSKPSGAGPIVIPNRYGPHHSNQADLLSGTNGYEYAGYTYDHTNPHYTGIEDACVGCHKGTAQIHAGYTVGGHSFNMEDEEGNSLVMSCGDTTHACHRAVTYDLPSNQRPSTFAAFKHGDITDLDQDGTVESNLNEMAGLLEILEDELVDAGLFNAGTGLPVPKPAGIGVDSAGAVWNFVSIEEDRSHGLHNFSYAVDLMISSINYMQTGNPNGGAGVAPKPRQLAAAAH